MIFQVTTLLLGFAILAIGLWPSECHDGFYFYTPSHCMLTIAPSLLLVGLLTLCRIQDKWILQFVRNWVFILMILIPIWSLAMGGLILMAVRDCFSDPEKSSSPITLLVLMALHFLDAMVFFYLFGKQEILILLLNEN